MPAIALACKQASPPCVDAPPPWTRCERPSARDRSRSRSRIRDKAAATRRLLLSMQLDIATTVRRTDLRTAPFATRRAWLGGPGGRLVNVRWFKDPDGNTLSII